MKVLQPLESYVFSKNLLERVKIELLFAKQRGSDLKESLDLIQELLDKYKKNSFVFM